MNIILFSSKPYDRASFQALPLPGDWQLQFQDCLLTADTAALAEGCEVSVDDVERSLAVLGLNSTATLEGAEDVWRETIDTLNLPKMANLGETFVSAAINRITRINDAYKTILHFHQHLETVKRAATDVERFEKQAERSKEPSTRDNLSGALETKLTGVGVAKPDKE